MKKEKLHASWPWDNKQIWVHNRLQNKAVHVIIMPNQDYVIGEMLVSFVGIGSSALGIIKTGSDLVRLLRTLSLIRNLKDVLDQLKTVIPKSAITLRPGENRDVYSSWFSDPQRFLHPLTTIAEAFGGKTRTMIITDEDFKNTVKFEPDLDKAYYIDETGVAPPMHYWNGGHVISGLLSSASPSLIRKGQDEMLMVYRAQKGNGILLAELKNGNWDRKDQGWFRTDSKQAIGGAVMQGNLLLVARDPDGDQMFTLWRPDRPIPFDDHPRWMGPDIQGKPSATTLGDTTYAVAKHYPGDAVMWASRRGGESPKFGNTLLETKYSPSIQAYKGKLYLFFVRMDTKQICVAVSDDGQKWTELRNDVAYTSSGVGLTVYKDRLYVFYRDYSGNGLFYMWTEDGSRFDEPPHRYFGFDVANEPTVSAMPGDNGILVAGILTAEWRIIDVLDVPDDEAIIWTILMPWEPPKVLGLEKPVKEKPAAAAKKAGKKAAKKLAARKVVAKGKATAARKAMPRKSAKKARKPVAAGKRKK